MKKINVLAVLIFVLAGIMVLSGCASKTVRKDEFSGYLGRWYYTAMEKIRLPSGAVALNWTAPDSYSTESRGKYFYKPKLMVDRVVWHPAPQPGPQVRSEVLAEITRYFRACCAD